MKIGIIQTIGFGYELIRGEFPQLLMVFLTKDFKQKLGQGVGEPGVFLSKWVCSRQNSKMNPRFSDVHALYNSLLLGMTCEYKDSALMIRFIA